MRLLGRSPREPPMAYCEPDHYSTKCPHPNNRGPRFRDDGFWHAEEKPERQAHEPPWPRELGGANGETYGKPIEESGDECGSLVGELHWQHAQDGHGAEDHTTDDANGEAGHAISSGEVSH